MDRDELFIDTCLKAKLLTPEQIEECRRLRSMLADNGFTITLPEVVAKKELLTGDQMRLVNISIRYEEMRENDISLGDFILRKGFLAPEKVNECLSAQEAPWREGRHFPRLDDLLVQKGHVTPPQLHVILRAWDQLDHAEGRKIGSSPHMPRTQPAVPPPEALSKAATQKLPTKAAPPKPSPIFDRKTLEAGLVMENLRVTLRRSKMKDGGGEMTVHVIDLAGSLDGHSSRPLDVYLNDLIDSGATRLVADCEKLEYISSAGIGVLTGAVKRCRDAKGDVRLCKVGEKVNKIMSLVGIQTIVRFYADDRGAIMSFKYG